MPRLDSLNLNPAAAIRSDRSAPPPDPYAEITRLARDCSSKHRYLAGVLRGLAAHFESPYAAVHVRYASEIVQDECHRGPSNPEFWKPSVQRFLTDSLAEPKPLAKLLRAKSGTAKVALLSAPFFDPNGPAIGAVALVAAQADESTAHAQLARLAALTRLASFASEYVGMRSAASEKGPARIPSAIGTTVEEWAFTITNELRNKVGCEQVALGLATHGRIRLLAISGLDEVKAKSPGVTALRAAMEECLDAAATIAFSREEAWTLDGKPALFRLHKQWHAESQGDATASVPLRLGDQVRAVLSLRRHAQQPFSREELDKIRSRVEIYVPNLLVARQASRGLCRHAWESAAELASSFISPGRFGRKLMAALIASAAVWVTFGTLPYRVTLSATLVSEGLRHVAAPFDAVLASAMIEEGMPVQQGDVLCELDTRDLRQQRAELQAQEEVLSRELDRSRADSSPVDLRLAESQQKLVQANLAMIERRIEQASIRAPMSGLVVAGDLRKRVGEALSRGAPLFQIAPTAVCQVELNIPQSLVDDVQPDGTGTFAPNAAPEWKYPIRVLRIAPGPQVRERMNVYVAEAEFATDPQRTAGYSWHEALLDTRLRPGAEGIARMDIGRRRVWWIALHGLLDSLRMNGWL